MKNEQKGELELEEAVPGIWTVAVTLEDGTALDRKTIAVPDGTVPEDVLAYVLRVFVENGVEVGEPERVE